MTRRCPWCRVLCFGFHLWQWNPTIVVQSFLHGPGASQPRWLQNAQSDVTRRSLVDEKSRMRELCEFVAAHDPDWVQEFVIDIVDDVGDEDLFALMARSKQQIKIKQEKKREKQSILQKQPEEASLTALEVGTEITEIASSQMDAENSTIASTGSLVDSLVDTSVTIEKSDERNNSPTLETDKQLMEVDAPIRHDDDSLLQRQSMEIDDSKPLLSEDMKPEREAFNCSASTIELPESTPPEWDTETDTLASLLPVNLSKAFDSNATLSETHAAAAKERINDPLADQKEISTNQMAVQTDSRTDINREVVDARSESNTNVINTSLLSTENNTFGSQSIKARSSDAKLGETTKRVVARLDQNDRLNTTSESLAISTGSKSITEKEGGFIDNSTRVGSDSSSTLVKEATTKPLLSEKPQKEVLPSQSLSELNATFVEKPNAMDKSIENKLDESSKSEFPGPASTKATIRPGATEELVVVFKESSSRRWLSQPFSTLQKLGYNSDDIVAIDSDALQLIIKEKLPRPSSGVPSRWKTNQDSSEIAKILSRTDAQKWLQSETGTRTQIPDPTTQDKEKDDKGFERKMPPANKAKRENQEAELRSRRPADKPAGRKDADQDFTRGARGIDERTTEEEIGTPRRKGLSKDEWREERRAKRASEKGERKMYTGRQQPIKRQIDDPPPPKGFWPDIDSFRSMLRDEAGLRLRILGDDWSSAVKDESDWRLNLYKEWLWTLHNGIGNPIVESRSDRMRRMDRERAKNQAQEELARRKRRSDSKR